VTPIFKNNLFLLSFILFVVSNITFYLWMDNFNKIIPFSPAYGHNAYHYKQDPRANKGNIVLLNALGQWDSQWYLKIADKGYRKHPSLPIYTVESLSYNFFPLFPMLIGGINLILKNIESSAFIVENIILVFVFLSLYFVVSKWFSQKVAAKTIFLLFLFPFSIFLRGYYTEGLRLLFFIWFCFGIKEKKYFIAAIFVSLLSVTNGISIVLLPYFISLVFISFRKGELILKKALSYVVLAVLPFLIWVGFCFIQTGNPLYFAATRFAWYRPSIPIFHNIGLLFLFPFLSPSGLYGSGIDVSMVILTIIVAAVSKKTLPFRVWFATVILAFTPLLVQDTISFARFTSVLFPFFAYIAYKMNNKYYFLCIFIFIFTLLITSLLFINWYWIE
jgi:hypothetical protein